MSRPDPQAIASASKTTFEVQLCDDTALFYRRDPVPLILTPTTLTLAEHILPHTLYTVQKGLGSQLVITSRKTALTIRAHTNTTDWRLLTALLCPPKRHSPPAFPHYELHEELGRGAFGVVRRATAPDGAVVAVKQVCKKRLRGSPAAFAAARRELAVARMLPVHENVVRVVEARETATHFVLVMELLRGGTLLQYLQGRVLSAEGAVDIVRQVLLAVAHVHLKGLVHRDVKLENLSLIHI